MKVLYYLVISCFLGNLLYAESDWPIYPQENQKKWRIAYYEGGAYGSYDENLVENVLALMELGWIPSQPIPQEASSKETWEFLATQLTSPYIEFVKNGFYSANWEKDLGKKYSDALLKRLNNDEFDMLWAMGTRAGLAFANDTHSVPTIVLSTSDAVAAGIVKSAEDSGFDHVHARVNPYRFESPLRLFHKTVKFKRLGLPFQNSEEGKSYAAYSIVIKLSQELEFEVIECHLPDNGNDQAKGDQDAINCINQLAPNVDAIYLTEWASLKERNIHNLVPIFLKYKIPTLSQYDHGLIRKGVLMTVTREIRKAVGLFSATTMAKIFNGAQPRELSQIFSPPVRTIINMKTALEIGFEVPSELLDISDQIYTKIEP